MFNVGQKVVSLVGFYQILKIDTICTITDTLLCTKCNRLYLAFGIINTPNDGWDYCDCGKQFPSSSINEWVFNSKYFIPLEDYLHMDKQIEEIQKPLVEAKWGNLLSAVRKVLN